MKPSKRIFRRRYAVPIVIIAAWSLLRPIQVLALEWRNGDWQAHGFLSQGLVYTDNNRVFGDSENVSLDFREMGVNGSAKLLPNLLLSAQGVYRAAGASDTQEGRLDFAQLDYNQPLLDSKLVLGARGGRVKIPFGLYNDTRDVLWTRPTVLLPQSIYFDTLALRQAMIAADGGIVYARYTLKEHRFGVEFLTAEPQDDTGGATAFLTNIPNAQGHMGGRSLLLGRAVYEWMGGRGRLMFSVVDLDRGFHSALPTVPSGNVRVLYPLFSGQYNAERWSLTTEYGWIDSQRTGFTPTPLTNTSESFYVQGEYRFTDAVTGVLRYDVFHVSREDRDGKALAQMTGLPRHRFFARDLTAGVRWEFSKNFLLAADYHYVNGTAWLNGTDNPSLIGGVSDWSLFTMMLSFRF